MAVTVIPFVFPGIPQVRCAFQTRQGGFSEGVYAGGNISYDVGDNPDHVAANLEDLRRTLGVDSLVSVRQVHGKTMLLDPDPAAEPQEADGLSTSMRKVGLLIRTADCQPVLLADMSGRHIAALHVGWRGNRINFIGSGVSAFCARYGLRPATVCAVRGPSLGPACAQFVNYDVEWSHYFDAWFDARTQTVNLWRLTRDQLLSAGISSEHIFSLDLCTASLPELFYSYRSSRVTGRQASVIWME